jgi:hypothetical protein
MTDYIDTREGWREATEEDYRDATEWLTAYSKSGGITRRWVREEPVPPLPTEPYTAVRVKRWTGKEHDYLLQPDGKWLLLDGSGRGHAVADYTLAEDITSWELLAEPRAGAVKRAEESARRLTAKAVLDRVHELQNGRNGTTDGLLVAIAREFGVES